MRATLAAVTCRSDGFAEKAQPLTCGRLVPSCGRPLPGAVARICRKHSHDIPLIGQSSCKRKPAVYGDSHGRKRHVRNLDDPGGGIRRDNLRLRTVCGSGSRGRLPRDRHEQRGPTQTATATVALPGFVQTGLDKPCSMHGQHSSQMAQCSIRAVASQWMAMRQAKLKSTTRQLRHPRLREV